MKEFLEGLLVLINKHEIEIEAEDRWQGYTECGQDIQILVIDKDYNEIKFGTLMTKEKIENAIQQMNRS